MRFGILLLILIAAFSVVGSVIPQGRELSWYVQNYPNSHPLLLILQLNKVFESWYFVLLLVLLCLNLTLCSLIRIVSVVRGGKRFVSSAAALPNLAPLTAGERDRLERHLTNTGCRREAFGDTHVYYKHRIGRYGSFITHLAILLTVIFGAAALYLPQVHDQDCMPGEEVRMADGLALEVRDFSAMDDSGKLAFQSTLRVTLPDGRQSGWQSVRVNHPMSFGSYKIYQQTYGTAGSVTVTNLLNGGSDTFLMTDLSFLSMDNLNGVWFVALYPDYIVTPEGELMPAATGDNSYPHPIYYVQTVDGEDKAMRLLLPGDTVEIGPLRFLFNDPVSYPGLRIKHTPLVVNALLIVCFVLMIAGLYLIFFLPPVLVKLDRDGYAVGGPKPEGMRFELERLLQSTTEEEFT